MKINGVTITGGSGSPIIQLTNQTLATAGWTLVSGYYTYTFSNADIASTSRVDFTPDTASNDEVTTCGMQAEVTVATGNCTFFSLFSPQTDITGDITIFPTT